MTKRSKKPLSATDSGLAFGSRAGKNAAPDFFVEVGFLSMDEDDNTVLRYRLRTLWAACCQLFEPLPSPIMISQDADVENQPRGYDEQKQSPMGVAPKPPYYSGVWNSCGVTLNLIGGATMGSSLSALQNPNLFNYFLCMFPFGLCFITAGSIALLHHTKCERWKAEKLREDDQRKGRINRYCKRYKKAAKRYRVQHHLVDSYQWQALADARPQFLNSSDEFSEACTLLSETRFPLDVSSNEIERGLWSFLIDANSVREDLLSTKGTWKIGMWANGASYYKQLPNGVKRLANRTEEEAAEWRKRHKITFLAETEGRLPPKEGEIFPPERGI